MEEYFILVQSEWKEKVMKSRMEVVGFVFIVRLKTQRAVTVPTHLNVVQISIIIILFN